MRKTHSGWGHWVVSPPPPDDTISREVWGNRRFTVAVRDIPAGDWPAMVHLSIHNHDRSIAAHDWRDLQRIKNEIVGSYHEAVELYPSEHRRMDTSNEFHLYVLAEENNTFPFGEFGRAVCYSKPRGRGRQRKQRPDDPDPNIHCEPIEGGVRITDLETGEVTERTMAQILSPQPGDDKP